MLERFESLTKEQITFCAEAAHEMNRIWCRANGDFSQEHWETAPQWQRDSAINGVKVALAGATPEDQHNAWMTDKLCDGWRYGEIKDPVAKTHPCIVPYVDLPEVQQLKDDLYLSTVEGMAAAFWALGD